MMLRISPHGFCRILTNIDFKSFDSFNFTTSIEVDYSSLGVAIARRVVMPKVLVMVCVSKQGDCGRHCCALLRSPEKQEKCFVQPVWCWRCVQRQGGIPDLKLVKLEEVSERFSTILESVQIEFGLELSYPAVYTASEFEAGGWASEAGLSREVVVGAVEVGIPTEVMRQRGMLSHKVSVVAFGDDGRYHCYGAAPPEFLGPGLARDYLTATTTRDEASDSAESS